MISILFFFLGSVAVILMFVFEKRLIEFENRFCQAVKAKLERSQIDVERKV